MSEDNLDHRLATRLAAARRNYEGSFARLPAEAAARLAASRAKAVHASEGRLGRRWLLPAGLVTAAAFAAAAAVVLVVRPFEPPEPPASPAAMQIVLSGEDYDLYRNLDFYAWAAGQEGRKGGNDDKGG